MAISRTLKTVVFMGSARDVVPPWGGEKRTGDRVLSWVKQTLEDRKATYGDVTVAHDVTVLDPLEVCMLLRCCIYVLMLRCLIGWHFVNFRSWQLWRDP